MAEDEEIAQVFETLSTSSDRDLFAFMEGMENQRAEDTRKMLDLHPYRSGHASDPEEFSERAKWWISLKRFV